MVAGDATTGPGLVAGGNVGTNLDEVRRHNLSTVLRYVHRRGPATRAELTAMTGLNRSTIRDLVAELSARGLVVEGEPVARGGPGRPSPLVSPAADRAVVLAIEISVDSIAAAIVGVGGTASRRVRTERVDVEPEAVVDAVMDLARPLLCGLGRGTRVLGAGAAIAAVIRRDDGLVHFGPNLGWREVPLGELLEAALGGEVRVRIGNDGDLGALAEHTRGAAVGVDELLYLSAEVGVGGGIVTTGVPLAGVTGYAGEVGHMLINPGGVACRCGAVGCWETETGELGLLRHAGRAAHGGRADVAEVLEAAASGDTAAIDAVDETARWLGLGIGGLVNALNPEVVVLGGFFAVLHELAPGVIEEAAALQGLAVATAAVTIVPSALGVDSVLLGAAELAFQDILQQPGSVPFDPADELIRG